MKHLTEEELIAQAYGEGDQAGAAEHLDRCTECSRAWAALRADLEEIRFPEPPARDASYGEKVWAQVSGALPLQAISRKTLFPPALWTGLSYAAAAVFLCVCTFAGGRMWERRHTQPIAAMRPETKAQQAAPARVVVVVLGDHLDRSERLLVELKHADASRTDMFTPLSEEAQSLLEANRICRRNALNAEDSALTSALDRLDHLLQELASQPEGLSAARLTRLQHEMNADGLLFEVRVLRSRLPNDPPPDSAETKGDKI